ncbi:MAG: MlaE family lipid ABC transporter permease subunit [Sulfuricurvum sp.]|jgi:phospholipid/cholesterol/gamma-HCH transport system permease protein|uniref:ABC transporter permease n=1 Tax=Sulfuricurvum sp. TaxID=2025608 RepID=UPI0025D3C640|nr:ABC transporter permease [Sulfuricurvum sp.]MCI4405693.1 MlaE family lipid ABC transporter permease subunit [Sulfuricurvum sp.]
MQNIACASIEIIDKAGKTHIVCSGAWTIESLGALSGQFEHFHPTHELIWDLGAITAIDTAGVALWQNINESFQKQGYNPTIIHAKEEYIHLYNLLYSSPSNALTPPPLPSRLYRIGKAAYETYSGILAFIAFLGEAFILLFHTLRHPHLIRYRSIGAHILETGAKALPIIAISAFLIGVVVAYQSVVQLQKFGADIFIVDTIGISLTRELAPLITAIVVAGRSGSAFTAQIGTMKMTQEIDAMKTMGFDPFIFLVWPRVIALMIVMPLLIFFADMIGIFGGMVIAATQSHLSFSEFTHRLQGALALKHYLIGIIKGPFFAFLIAFVGTHRGFQVSMNTESIGQYTTKSVVNAIFLVIACDALFSVLLTELKL